MKIIKKTFTILFVIAFILLVVYFTDLHFDIISGIKEKVKNLKEKVEVNQPSVISSLIADPTTVSPGGNSTITCTASDPDEDTLIYSWTKTDGTISGSGYQVTWTAPSTAGTYTITCTVSDGKRGTASKSVDINVIIVSGGTKKWEFLTGYAVFSSPTIGSDGIIYVGSSDYNFYAVNLYFTQRHG